MNNKFDNVILEIKNISKRFEGTQALDNVSFNINRGEVRALVGENGAGKSTLVKIIGGAIRPDSGKIFIEGIEENYGNPKEILKKGISIIYQELDLAPALNSYQNIFLGSEIEKYRLKVLDKKKMLSVTKSFLEKMNGKFNPLELVRELKISEQQIVAICKALVNNSKIIIMDEPSATLGSEDLENLFKLIRNLSNEGISVIYISHRLEELFKIADSVTILRDGKLIATRLIKEINKNEIIEMMIGRNFKDDDLELSNNLKSDNVVLEVKNLESGNFLKNINFKVNKGDILGILGLIGSGKETLSEILFGIQKKYNGEIIINGKKGRINSPKEAIKKSITYIPSDRKVQGIFLSLSSFLNVIVGIVNESKNKVGFLNKKNLLNVFFKLSEKLQLKVSSFKQLAKDLSGGNQQKLIIARCLAKESDILIINEPTRGIDVGTKLEIYKILLDIAKSGKTIIIVSSEIQEIKKICNKIMILKDGQNRGLFKNENIDQKTILNLLLVS